MKVRIAPDFKNLLPPLNANELAILKESVLADRAHNILPRIIVWKNNNNTIVDGHNQYDIRSKNGCTIKYQQMNFADRDAAMRYALKVQLGRRNLEPTEVAIAYAKLPRNDHGGDRTSENGEQVQNLELATIREQAEEAGVSVQTLAHGRKVIDNGSVELVKAATKAEVAISDAASIVHLPKGEQDKILARFRASKIPTLRAGLPKPKKPRAKATDFDPEALEKKGRKTKSGKPYLTVRQRKSLHACLGKLIKALDVAGIYDEFRDPINDMAKRFKEV